MGWDLEINFLRRIFVKTDPKKIKGGASNGSRDEGKKAIYNDPDGHFSTYTVNAEGEPDENGEFMRPFYTAELYARLKIYVEPTASSYSILLADHVLFEGEMTEKIMAILGCCYPQQAEKIKRLGPKKESAE